MEVLRGSQPGDGAVRPVRGGFSVAEVVMVVLVISACLVPLFDLGRTTVNASDGRLEDLLVRQRLDTLVQRAAAIPLRELSRLTGTPAGAPDWLTAGVECDEQTVRAGFERDVGGKPGLHVLTVQVGAATAVRVLKKES